RQGMQKAAPASKVKGLFPQTAAPTQTPAVPSPNLKSLSGTVPTPTPQTTQQTVPVSQSVPQEQTASPFAMDDSFDFPAPPSESDTPLHWEPSPIQSQRSAASSMADSSEPRPKTREELLWEEGSSSSGIWSVIHKMVAPNPWLCFVLPPLVALPIGIVTGILDAINPIILISFFGVMFVYGFLGSVVFECFKGAGIRVRIFSAAYGFFTACVGVWAFVFGGMLWDVGIIVPGEETEITAVECASPLVMAKYIQIKAENMTMGRVGRHDSETPVPFFNYLFIVGLLIVAFICTVTTAWGPMKLKSEEEAEAASNGYGYQ
ncbi:MAG: hypothetical protein Q4G59_07930, partial [Planctomycetia bacterium]|nr:hypothetical protein [Planctomycetia bacterium]